MTDRKLTVVCCKWKGWRDLYDGRHVNALGRMLEQYLKIPYRFICFTDDPTGIEYETMPLWDDPIVPNRPSHHNSYRRLKFFSPEMVDLLGGGWVMNMDLDCLVLSDITNLVTWDDIRLFKGGRSIYNGSFWLHKLGTRTQVWNKFDPDKSPQIAKRKHPKWNGSDQLWLSYMLPGERTYSGVDGVHRSEGYYHPQRRYKTRLIFFAGNIEKKPWSEQTRLKHPKIYEKYMRFFDA